MKTKKKIDVMNNDFGWKRLAFSFLNQNCSFMIITAMLKTFTPTFKTMYQINLKLALILKKTRPCVILSPNEINKFLKTVVVALITTNLKKYPTRINVKHNTKNGMIAIDQIQTDDKTRILKRFEGLTKSEIADFKL